MIPVKARITRLLLKTAKKFPWLFSKWFQEVAKYYGDAKFDSDERSELNQNWELASYFGDDISWKAVSVVCQISHDELEMLHQWMKKSNSRLNYSEKRDRDSFKVNFDYGSGYRNIGWINFRSEAQILSVARIELPDIFSNNCYVTISKFSAGLTYLSMYFMLKESATQKIQKVDISEIEGFRTLQSLNPISKRFKVMEHHNREHAVQYLLKANFNSVCNDTKSTVQKLFKQWKIRKSNDEMVLVADFFRNDDQPYFSKREEPIKSYRSDKEYVIFDKWHEYRDLKASEDPCEHFCILREDDDLSLDAIFIKSQDVAGIDPHNNFSKIGLEIHDSHLFLSTIIELSKQYTKVADFVNTALVSQSKKPEENHDVLFKSSIDLDLITERLESIDSAIQHDCEMKYAKFAEQWVKYRISVTKKLNEVISKRRRFSSDSLQVQNLRFNRKYSLMVGILVVVQVVLACLTINWGQIKESIEAKYEYYSKNN